jgi:peptide/nickel transport system substrate-binding protein
MLFEARWNGIYMMPKHIFESVDDLAAYTNEDPVVLGAYIPTETDPNGYWELYTRRDNWESSPAGVIVGQAGPQYVLTIFYGDSATKAIAMSRGELDVFFDVDFEAFETVLDTTPTAKPTRSTPIRMCVGHWRWRSTSSSCRPSISVV